MNETSPDAGTTFARTALSIAAEVEAAESQIKQAVVTAARAGDCRVVIDIMTAWRDRPTVEVVLQLPDIIARLESAIPPTHQPTLAEVNGDAVVANSNCGGSRGA